MSTCDRYKDQVKDVESKLEEGRCISLGSESRLAVWLLSRCREKGRVPQEKSQQRKNPAIFRK